MRWFQLDPSYWLYYAADWCRDELADTRTGAVGIEFFELCAELWYWLIIGALCSALASHYLPRSRLASLLTRHRAGSILGASLLGLISPLCTFAAIPVVSRVLMAGVPAPPLMAFLFTSPLMNPALFAYTYGALGLEMALARTITAFLIGLIAGVGSHILSARQLFDVKLSPDSEFPAVAGGSGMVAIPGRSLVRRFLGDLAFIGRGFTLGILIAAVSTTFLSPELIGSMLGAGSRWSVPTAVLLGVPLYACGGAAIPIVETMMRLGMTPGAALAFFIAGPATKFHTVGALGAVMGRRVLAWYLIVMISSALLFGYFYPMSAELPARTYAFP